MEEHGIKLIECTNKSKNIWVVRWGIKKIENEQFPYYDYQEERFNHIPTEQEIKDVINNYYNKVTDQRILTGFKWKDISVWLSVENQFNYKATYDLAVQTSGKNLPVTFKFGTDEKPMYHTFNTVDELSEFYISAISYVQKCYTDGWKQKDSFDYTKYFEVVNKATYY